MKCGGPSKRRLNPIYLSPTTHNRLLPMADIDFYARLEVNRSCTDVQLQQAYRKKALVLHPHRRDAGKENGQGNSNAFRELGQVPPPSSPPPSQWSLPAGACV